MSELRISLRRLIRSPGYVAAAVLSLAIGIGICMAAFSLVNVMVFEDVPGIRDRRDLIRINWTTEGGLFSTAFDPLSLVSSPGVLALMTVAASLAPVLRAARIDPVHALREL